MARPCSPPVAALALLLLLCLSYSAAATRLLRDQRNGVAIVKAADAATDDLVALRGEGGNGGEAVSPSEQVMAEGGTAEEEVCEEGNDGDECMQRRLLHDAHLDYIYTQHKGRP